MEVRDILEEALMRVRLVVISKTGPAPTVRPASAPLEVRITSDDKVQVGGLTLTVDEFLAKAAERLKGVERVDLVLEPQSSPRAVAEVMTGVRAQGAQVNLLHADTSTKGSGGK